MKLVIDISETDYNIYKRFGNNGSYTEKIIANGVPYKQNERPKSEWIPVSERLPEENGVYLVTLEYVDDSEIVNEIDMAWFMYSEKDDSNNGFHKAYPIMAWQPLPEPYER
jgi:hypothetical protein